MNYEEAKKITEKRSNNLVISFFDLTDDRKKDIEEIIRERLMDDFKALSLGRDWRKSLEASFNDGRDADRILDDLTEEEIVVNWHCVANF